MSNLGVKKVYVVDGNRFNTLAEAAAEFTNVLGLTMPWNGGLDAFNDFLNGGFGTPDEGFVLVWQNSEASRQRLGHGETIHWLKCRMKDGHPSNVTYLEEKLAAAQRNEGPTLFDILVEIIRGHSDIELRLG